MLGAQCEALDEARQKVHKQFAQEYVKESKMFERNCVREPLDLRGHGVGWRGGSWSTD